MTVIPLAQRVRFWSHACLALEGEGEVLLTDPWFFGDVFNDSWSLRAPPDLEMMDLRRVRHVWISHQHPDHLHLPTLRWIRERAAGPLTAYYRHHDPAVRESLVKLGYRVVDLVPHQETVVAPDLSITLFPTRDDSALVIRLGDRVILNQNDCSLARREVQTLRKLFPRLDAWFFQFSLGGYYANADDPVGLEAARQYHLRKIERYFGALQPTIFVPFASFFCFSKEANAFLNAWILTPAQVVRALPHLPTQILYSQDVVLWGGWEERNTVNLARWEATLKAPVPTKPHEQVDEGAIVAAGQALVRDLAERGLARYGPAETHLEIRETGRALAVDFRKGCVGLLARADPRKSSIAVPGEELLYFLKSPHGGSLFFTSCFRVVNPERWRQLREFRNTTTRWAAAKSHIASLDRRYCGGHIRRCYDRLRAPLMSLA